MGESWGSLGELGGALPGEGVTTGGLTLLWVNPGSFCHHHLSSLLPAWEQVAEPGGVP